MKAMILERVCWLPGDKTPLKMVNLPVPDPADDEILIKVSACGVCHTELDEIEGRTPPPVYPVVPGHQVVGRVEECGKRAVRFKKGARVGVAWIFSACGRCSTCKEGNENLCPRFRATGRDANGGYAEYMTVREDYAHPIPEVFTDSEAAPLLCAGAIGYRSLRLADLKKGERLGFTGFGASAHLVLKMVRHLFPKMECYVFARSEKERAFALELGAKWTGDTEKRSPKKLHSIIDTTPAWGPVVAALGNLENGGRLVINAIRKEAGDREQLLNINYTRHLWMEKEIKSVANLTRDDVNQFLKLAAEIPIKPEVQEYPLEGANEALVDLKGGHVRGAKVLRI